MDDRLELMLTKMWFRIDVWDEEDGRVGDFRATAAPQKGDNIQLYGNLYEVKSVCWVAEGHESDGTQYLQLTVVDAS